MLLNYLKLSLRLLGRNPFFTCIKVAGLAVGFASFLILWQHATNELAADQFFRDADRIVRINLNWQWSDDGSVWGQGKFGATRAFHAPLIQSEFSEVESFTRFMQQPEFTVERVGHGNRVVVSIETDNGNRRVFNESKLIYADSNFFDFFGLPLAAGTASEVLSHPHDAVLSERVASKYFGEQDPIGKELVINDTIRLNVSGVFRDLPYNMHVSFDMVVSDVGLTEGWHEQRYPMVATYLKLNNAAGIDKLEDLLNANKQKYWSEELTRPYFKVDFIVQPVTELSFNPQYWYAYHATYKSRSQLILYKVIAILILAMAWINYINLTVSEIMRRMMDVAARKVSGAMPADVAKQFAVQATLTTLLALAVAFTIQQLVQTPAMALLQIDVPEFNAVSLETWILFGAVALNGIGVTAAYPVVMSMTHNPRLLLTKYDGKRYRGGLPSFLVVFQYASAMTLILWAFIVYIQLSFILTKNIGLIKDQVIVVEGPVVAKSNYSSRFEFLINEVSKIDGVTDVTSSRNLPGDPKLDLIWLNRINRPGLTAMSTNGGVDERFIPFYGIKMLAGRNFLPTDKEDALIISRHASVRLGFNEPEDAIGVQVKVSDDRRIHIIGVIEDYRLISMANLNWDDMQNITGNGICLVYKNYLTSWNVPERLSLKVNSENPQETLSAVKRKYDEVFPGNAFNWFFLDDHINAFYENEKISRNKILMFTLLAIGISCLGLLGLMKISAEERVKEIGIRKVLGAGTGTIAGLLLRNVIVQVVIAMVISLPVSYYLSLQYLTQFLEQIELQWWYFVLPVLILLIIMLMTIGTVLWKAAGSNLVEALKHE